MKKVISILSLVLLIGISGTYAQCCGGKTTTCTKSTKVANSEKAVKVYYFHNTRRCATCKAVEDVTKEALSENYGKKVPFESVNIEENTSKALAKKYGVAGQTLLIVGKGKPQNLTNFAFMNARTNPDKLKTKITSVIGKL